MEQMASELGLTDVSYMDGVLTEAAAGTVWEPAAQSKNSVFFKIIGECHREPYAEYLAAVKADLPNRFLSHATKTQLEEWAGDFDLERDAGEFAQFKISFQKASEDEVEVEPDTVFYVDALTPVRFTTGETSYLFASGIVDCADVVVTALELGTASNVLLTQITKCETALPISDITNYETVRSGRAIETDDELRARIEAKRFAQDAETGVEARYIAALKSVEAVKNAILTSVEDDTAALNFTIYGEGVLPQETIDAAQAAVEAILMQTDKAAVSAATPTTLALTVKIDAEYTESEVAAAIQTFFTAMEQGNDFESSLLADYLYTQFPTFAGKGIRITPASADAPAASFFEPEITFEAWS